MLSESQISIWLVPEGRVCERRVGLRSIIGHCPRLAVIRVITAARPANPLLLIIVITCNHVCPG